MKWEYQVIKKWGIMSDDDFLAEMNEAGSAGWELVGVTFDSEYDNTCAYFKRAVKK